MTLSAKVPLLVNSCLLSVAINLFNDTPVLIIVIYRPPKQNSKFMSEIAELLSVASTNYDKILLSGDFNLHIDSPSDSNSLEVIRLLETFDLKQQVGSSTHKLGHILDLVITKGLNTQVSQISDVFISDHFCIFFQINLEVKKKVPESYFKKRYIDSETAKKFQTVYNNSAHTALSPSCNYLVYDLRARSRVTLDLLPPLKRQTSLRTLNTPWFTENVRPITCN